MTENTTYDKKRSMSLLYMGTPNYAVAPLRSLLNSGLFDKISVVTRQDSPQGRGLKDKFSEVKRFAIDNAIDVYQPVNLKKDNFEAVLQKLDPDIIIVAAYGMILPEYVLNFPRFGCINIHASLLPEYRGAAPINRVILDGKQKTGITIMRMDKGIDTGDILCSYEVPILPLDNFGSLCAKLSDAGASVIPEAVKLILSGEAVYKKQNDSFASYASKITSADQCIDWFEDAAKIVNRIRAFSPDPCANTITPDGRLLRISAAHEGSAVEAQIIPGTVIKAKKALEIASGNSLSLVIDELQPEGKRRMSGRDFINGRGINEGDVLSRTLMC
ncbi:MAG: methionyl-tRNA formyltransferase [Oscillospiraceae bacterium]|nr:methionyl-tRNA formyltransferase [Oscillospiraceae bacterium]